MSICPYYVYIINPHCLSLESCIAVSIWPTFGPAFGSQILNMLGFLSIFKQTTLI